MNIWVISDTHFNHKKLIDAEGRPENFNEVIQRKWRNTVDKNDLIIHLGDVIMGQDSQLGDLLLPLPGIKILCRGNHDGKSDNWYRERGFSFVCDYYVYKDLAFSHAPLTPLPFQGRDNYKKHVRLNIHGHFHNGKRRNEFTEDPYFDNDYYRRYKDHYFLINIEDTLSPYSLKSIVKAHEWLK